MKRVKEIEGKLKDYVKEIFVKYPEINTISIEVDVMGGDTKDIYIFEMNHSDKIKEGGSDK
jgi:hypothetical protein